MRFVVFDSLLLFFSLGCCRAAGKESEIKVFPSSDSSFHVRDLRRLFASNKVRSDFFVLEWCLEQLLFKQNDLFTRKVKVSDKLLYLYLFVIIHHL